MPIECNVNAAADMVVLTVSNPITVDEVMEEYGEIFNLPGFHNSINALWDFRKLELREISVGDIRRLVRCLHELGDRRGEGYKSALVMGKSVDYHLIKIYISIIHLVGNVRIRIFNKMDEAKIWLKSRDLGNLDKGIMKKRIK